MEAHTSPVGFATGTGVGLRRGPGPGLGQTPVPVHSLDRETGMVLNINKKQKITE
jgi:hypothetical protein